MSSHGSYWDKIGFSSSADEYDPTPPLTDSFNHPIDKWTLGNANKKILRKANNKIVRIDPDVLKLTFSSDYLFGLWYVAEYGIKTANMLYGDDATDLYCPLYGLNNPPHPPQTPTVIMYTDLVRASYPFIMEDFFNYYGEYPARGIFSPYGTGGPAEWSYGYSKNNYPWNWINFAYGPRCYLWRKSPGLWRLVFSFGAYGYSSSLGMPVFYSKTGESPLGEYTFEKKTNLNPGVLFSYNPSLNSFPTDDTFDPIGTITVASAF